MTRIARMMRPTVALALLLLAAPALAQTQPAPLPPPVPVATRPAEPTAAPRISAGHAAALGAGMFMGAIAGSALINGGALAALIGAAAGITVGHWYWTEHRDETD
jgi:predicted MFS family arabinose efflux permease